MTLAVLLQLFALFSKDELYQRHQSFNLRAAIAQTSPDPGIYVQIADQAFAELLLDADEPRTQEYQRLVHIFYYSSESRRRVSSSCAASI